MVLTCCQQRRQAGGLAGGAGRACGRTTGPLAAWLRETEEQRMKGAEGRPQGKRGLATQSPSHLTQSPITHSPPALSAPSPSPSPPRPPASQVCAHTHQTRRSTLRTLRSLISPYPNPLTLYSGARCYVLLLRVDFDSRHALSVSAVCP